MKKEGKSLSYIVKVFDINAQKIVDYDVLKHREDFIKKLKKKSATKEEFEITLQREFMYHYWSRSEYELIIRETDDGRILLLPWCGCSNPEDVAIDVTEDTSFNWRGFAKYHIAKQRYKDEAKISVFDQIMQTWPEVANYCWQTHIKYERDHPKFHD